MTKKKQIKDLKARVDALEDTVRSMAEAMAKKTLEDAERAKREEAEREKREKTPSLEKIMNEWLNGGEDRT